LAKIYDIDDEDIQKEYMSAFNRVVYLYDGLKENYEEQGFNENSDELLKNYIILLKKYLTHFLLRYLMLQTLHNWI